MDNVTHRWIDGPTATKKEWDDIEVVLASRGWISLNRETCRIYVAEADGELVGFSVFQLVPYTGPLWVEESRRGSGIAEHLATETVRWLIDDVQARGFMATADSQHTAKLCTAQGMKEVPVRVFARGGEG